MKFWQMVPYMEPEQLVAVARIAEEVGFEGVMGADHLLYPRTLNSPYPYTPDGASPIDSESPYPDPWVMTAMMAAVTTRLKFSTSIYVLPLRHPLEVAKATGTLSLLSNGRFILGAGAGWMKEEFDAAGVDFHTRGRRMNEMLEIMPALWSGDWVDFDGEFFKFDGIRLLPAPPSPVPVFIGGSSAAALRRTVKFGSGFIGHGNHPDEVAPLLRKIEALREEEGVAHQPFETVMGLTTPPDYDTFRRMADIGMTASVNYPFSMILGGGSTLDEKRRVMETFAEDFIVRPV